MQTASISERFSKGAQRYDMAASVQYRMADVFVQWLLNGNKSDNDCSVNDCSIDNLSVSDSDDTNRYNKHSNLSDGFPRAASRLLHITELGCGTGFLTQQLLQQFPRARINACDISSEMLAQCHIRTQGAVSLHQADAAHFETQHPADWIVSSFCLQWIEDLASVMQFHARRSKRLSICVPCARSFEDWKDAHAKAGLQHALWPLPDARELTRQMRDIAQSNGKQLRSRLYMVDEHHDSPLAFARHLRAIGADFSNARSNGAALKRVLDLLPTPYVARYEVLMLDVFSGA